MNEIYELYEHCTTENTTMCNKCRTVGREWIVTHMMLQPLGAKKDGELQDTKQYTALNVQKVN